MRYTEFKLYHQPNQLNEGYTKGDLAETVWGAAVTAAFAKYPGTANKADVVSIIKGLDDALTYTQTRNDGLKSKITDAVKFVNIISMQQHIDDLRNIESSIDKIAAELPGILSDANAQVRTAGLELKEIFANGLADEIRVGAEGGADQKGTKVDVSIVHRDSEGNKEVKRLGYSLKTDTAASGIMPVSQAAGINKGSGGQVEFFADIGIVDDIDDASIEEYNKLDAKLRALVEKNSSNGKIERAYEKELINIRQSNEGKDAFNRNIVKAAEQINTRVKKDGQEAAFFDDIINFLNKHINKDDPTIKLLTFDKKGAYTTTVEKFKENVRNLTVKAVPNTKNQRLDIISINDDGSKDLIIRIRFKASGGRFSGSAYRKSLKKKSVKAGKERASGYELLRYTLMVETGPGYKKSATVG